MENCILGWDAIQKHAFRLDGEAKSIYLGRDELGPAAISRVRCRYKYFTMMNGKLPKGMSEV
ncbi:hypothetical protein OUZ56_024624 [Daphnia magna]|uniref:Uncharacterized protein n=1 Tax=Daphnia magna TaxID=35525 RepID=A0ABR0B133_9CRUS|nr:hypothetical protein OUZ56_024624 [Daphnia magna]